VVRGSSTPLSEVGTSTWLIVRQIQFRKSHTVVSIEDRSLLLVIGGCSETSFIDIVEAYDPRQVLPQSILLDLYVIVVRDNGGTSGI